MDRSERIGGAAVAVLLQVGILWVLILGLGVSGVVRVPDNPIALFTVTSPPPPPPVIPPPKHRTKGKEGAAAPPNKKSIATEVQAPPPAIPIVIQPPVIAAPHPNAAADPTQGAAPVAGPGSGAGGVGDGTGSGGRGDGDGGGADDTPPRWQSGRLKFSDMPQELIDRGVGGVVEVEFAVETNGHVDDCRVTRSSGDRLLDTTTCRLIEQRFRYRPSRDGAGRPVRAYVVETHSWSMTTERRGDDDRDWR